MIIELICLDDFDAPAIATCLFVRFQHKIKTEDVDILIGESRRMRGWAEKKALMPIIRVTYEHLNNFEELVTHVTGDSIKEKLRCNKWPDVFRIVGLQTDRIAIA